MPTQMAFAHPHRGIHGIQLSTDANVITCECKDVQRPCFHFTQLIIVRPKIQIISLSCHVHWDFFLFHLKTKEVKMIYQAYKFLVSVLKVYVDLYMIVQCHDFKHFFG